MKNNTFLILLFALWCSVVTSYAQDEVKPFKHMSVSVNAGTLGVGIQLASPVTSWLSLRTGVMMFQYTYDYDYKDVIYYEVEEGVSLDYEAVIPMKAKANMVNGLLLADFFPLRNKRFHVTGGMYIGTSDIIKVRADYAVRPVEIGDVIIAPSINGRVAAHLKTNGFKPYVGFGYGRSVTQTKRFGFKVELGAMFHGSPKVRVVEGQDITSIKELEINEKISDFNKFLKDFNIYPVLNLQLNFRAF
ncbi:hypothetical protein [Parabacteroides sp. PF5-9]|uniref:hypothetical protein n=1 Tax=Parabacteroides sp. PF5-9 TaxID=1742404 RepID=UPI002477259E|nr:hypothetical protein [Parabacteroides sp. PF5-9]MDH6356579.1 hypothetical protein [Parabacteroides sp. PF5-9]